MANGTATGRRVEGRRRDPGVGPRDPGLAGDVIPPPRCSVSTWGVGLT